MQAFHQVIQRLLYFSVERKGFITLWIFLAFSNSLRSDLAESHTLVLGVFQESAGIRAQGLRMRLQDMQGSGQDGQGALCSHLAQLEAVLSIKPPHKRTQSWYQLHQEYQPHQKLHFLQPYLNVSWNYSRTSWQLCLKNHGQQTGTLQLLCNEFGKEGNGMLVLQVPFVCTCPQQADPALFSEVAACQHHPSLAVFWDAQARFLIDVAWTDPIGTWQREGCWWRMSEHRL